MRKFFIPLLLTAIALTAPESGLSAEKNRYRKRVADQREMNRMNHEAVLAEVRTHMDSINGRIKDHGGPHLALPLDENSINDVTQEEHSHTGLQLPETITGFVNAADVNLRTSSGLDGQVIGKLSFNEEVEIVGITDTTDTIGQDTDNWVLIRRADKTEGWVFGHYLQNVPARKGSAPSRGRETSKSLFRMPADGIITSPFGYRVHPVTKKRMAFHSGIDIGAPEGTPVKAAADGIVRLSAYKSNGYGNLVIIDHGENLCTYYGHLSKRDVRTGQKVKAGSPIGLVGSTGRSTGPHLHFEVRRGDKALNPDAFLR